MNLLEKLRQELLDNDKHNTWGSVLRGIHRNASDAGLTVEEGSKLENIDLNRYRNILPYDQTRVVLPGEGYINASYVTLDGTDLDLILTQGPMLHTVADFWKMVWNERCENIVMLSGFSERDRVMCHPYMPTKVNHDGRDTMSVGELFDITLKGVISHEYFEVRNLVLRYKKLNKRREVKHYHLPAWPDFDIPAGPDHLLSLLAEVHKQDIAGRRGPTIVHCSAGVGRSGSFAVIYGCIRMMAEHRDLANLDLPRIISELRKCRMQLVQTPQQLRFCWHALVSAMSSPEWCRAFGIPNPAMSSSEMSESARASTSDQMTRDSDTLYSLASNAGERDGMNGLMEYVGPMRRRYDERYKDRVRRRKIEADRMRARLLAMKERMKREEDDKLFYYILFFLVLFALFVAFCLMLKPK